MPFAEFKSFEDCVSKNQDKQNPEAYCAVIKEKTEGTSEEQNSRITLRNAGKVDVLKHYRDKENPELEGLEVGGIAITEGIHNGVFYGADELKPVAEGLAGKQLRIDHSTSVRDIIGKVTYSGYFENGNQKGIEFKAVVTDEDIAKKLKKGLVDAFSVGVTTELVKNGDQIDATKLQWEELSQVCDPADENARLTELYNSKQLKTYIKEIMEENSMVKTKKLQDEVMPVAPVEEPAGPTLEEVIEMVNALAERITALETPAEPEAPAPSEETMQDEEKKDEDEEEEKPKEEKKEENSKKFLKLEARLEALESKKLQKTRVVKDSTNKRELKRDSFGGYYMDNPFGGK